MAFLNSKKIFVFGMGKSGRAISRLLAGQGIDVFVCDDNEKAVNDFLASVAAEPYCDRITAVPADGGEDQKRFLDESDRVVLSPGISLEHPLVVRAQKSAIPVDAEIEAAYHFTDARIIGVTGTNGKSTTVGIIGDILEAGGVPSAVAGNVGKPFSEVVGVGQDFNTLVLELSSFQLDTVRDFRSDVAVLLNVTPDHLDRYHRSFDEYAASKARILNRSNETTWFVYNAEDEVCRRIAGGFGGNKLPFSSSSPLKRGVYLEAGEIVRAWEGRTEAVLAQKDFGPVGIHNLENAMAAVAAVTPLDVGMEDIRRALRAYEPLPHRMEVVRTVGGVTYINDSKATNVDATLKSLVSIDGGVILILGGRDKDGDFGTLIPHLDRVRAAILIGEATAAIRGALVGHCELIEAADMAGAVEAGRDLAEAGDTVLLAPACASFDMFESYQHRGEVFRSCVNAL